MFIDTSTAAAVLSAEDHAFFDEPDRRDVVEENVSAVAALTARAGRP
jgi:hypothetical protein